MTQAPLQAVEVQTGPDPQATVIWLHGLGADGHDFEPLVPQLAAQCPYALRFVLPHAPIRPVALNGGARMRAWYDIRTLDAEGVLAVQDEAGVRASTVLIGQLLQRELERGVAAARLVLAGFSQGSAMALFNGLRFGQPLAGIVALSGYMPLASHFAAERAAANQATPIFLAQGAADPVVDPALGEQTRVLLQDAGYPVEWHRYAMGHEVCAAEVADIATFLRRTLGPPDA